MNRTERVASALTLTLAIGSSWLFLASSRTPESSPGADHQPTLYITAAQWDILDETGQLKQRLQAVRMEQWAGEDGVRLLQPRLQARRQNGASWLATARRGWLYENDRPSVLQDNVVLRRARSADNGELALETGYLLISASGERIETDRPVALRAGHWTFTAGSLQARFNPDRIELGGRVRGVHD